jgi:hypothetical protein
MNTGVRYVDDLKAISDDDLFRVRSVTRLHTAILTRNAHAASDRRVRRFELGSRKAGRITVCRSSDWWNSPRKHLIPVDETTRNCFISAHMRVDLGHPVA